MNTLAAREEARRPLSSESSEVWQERERASSLSGFYWEAQGELLPGKEAEDFQLDMSPTHLTENRVFIKMNTAVFVSYESISMEV